MAQSEAYKFEQVLELHVGIAHQEVFGVKILTVVKFNIHLFLEPRSLPESDGHRDHGGIGGSKNKFFFLIVFQRLMP